MTRRTIAIIMAAAALVSCRPSAVKVPQYANRAEMIAAQMQDPDSKYVVVACHRGDWRNYPENSIPAIESIIAMGADIMELDLKLTKDSVLVLSHDATINRCTNGKGLVSDYTYEELMQFSLKRAHGVTIDTLKMPTLRQALETTKDRICVNVDQGYQFYDMVLEITEELGVTDQILIKGKRLMSDVKEKFGEHEHNMMYMPIIDLQKESGQALFQSFLDGEEAPMAYEMCYPAQDGKIEEAAAKAIAKGSKVWVNTIWASLCGGYGWDDDAAYQTGEFDRIYGHLLDMGVSMIQTDRPEMLINYLRSVGRHD